MSHQLAIPIALLLLATHLPAQAQLESQGNFRIDTEPVVLGQFSSLTFTGPPFSPFSLLVDVAPGTVTFPGFATLWLPLSPFLTVPITGIDDGSAVLPFTGVRNLPFVTPFVPALDGQTAWLQGVVLDLASPIFYSFSNAKSFEFSFADSYKPTFGNLIEPRAFHQTVPLPNGAYLVIGGGDGELLLPVALASCERYNPYLRTFAADQPMTEERTLHRATVLLDGRILVTGGSKTLGIGLSTAEIYDPVSGTWSPPIPMNGTRIAHTATRLNDGRVLVCGGSSSFVLTPPTSTNFLPIFQSGVATAELFDPVTDTFTPVATPMSENRIGQAATLLASGKVLISGGIRGGFSIAGAGAPLYAAGCDVFDPTTNSFSPAAAMAVPRIIHTQNLLPNGDVIAVGGAGGTFVLSLGSSEIYDESNDTWSPGPPIPGGQTIALHTTVELSNGDFYVGGGAVGGVGAFQGIDVAYRYDSANGFTVLNNLDTPRQAHTANLTPEGLLLIGGADAGDPVGPPVIPAMAMDTAIYWSVF